MQVAYLQHHPTKKPTVSHLIVRLKTCNLHEISPRQLPKNVIHVITLLLLTILTVKLRRMPLLRQGGKIPALPRHPKVLV